MLRTWPSTLLIAALIAGCGGDDSSPESTQIAADPALQRAQALFGVLPESMGAGGRSITDAKVTLGRALYHDTRLSRNHDLSCASCHSLDAYGVDPRPEAAKKGTSPGHRDQFGGRNSPTSLNAAIQLAQFWDGRAADVEEQAKGPILNPAEWLCRTKRPSSRY